MGHAYQEKFTIPFDFSDVNGNLKLPPFLSKLLDVSGQHSAELNRSDVYVLETYGLVWIVTDYEFDIVRLPRFSENVTIRTEAVSYNKLICHRRFEVMDETGELLMRVESYFALMDLEQRKIVPVPEDLLEPYHSEKVKKIARGAKYKSLEKPSKANYHVRFFDIDMNGHVNNSKYLDWMYDVLGYEFLKTHVPRHIHLKYNREVSPGGDVSSEFEMDGLVSHHQIGSDGQTNAQAIISWRVL
ncbi:acyl-ACP thioesterase domain-containing protein [Streptococcus moroccensis]|uniref:Medium-chain acyl-[acyl-carrier-protein] hydrolase n=1 Tax=Streptococcus moroccensis TaxID=1451356 RepID=A0ABT9YUA4_9STRE|nr:acyl-ACP thioesterase domain-containing protein [Streptococcus moroccensis]MDQ0223568.1 medium-chain acyl-[acyl-carrier-protein] hydrolase [Streptococcus moroccensis]